MNEMQIPRLTRDQDHICAQHLNDLEPEMKLLDHKIVCLLVRGSVIIYGGLQGQNL